MQLNSIIAIETHICEINKKKTSRSFPLSRDIFFNKQSVS